MYEQLELLFCADAPPGDADAAPFVLGDRVLRPGSLAAGEPVYVTPAELALFYDAEIERLRAAGEPLRWITTVESEIRAELATLRTWLSADAQRERAELVRRQSQIAATVAARQAAAGEQKVSA